MDFLSVQSDRPLTLCSSSTDTCLIRSEFPSTRLAIIREFAAAESSAHRDVNVRLSLSDKLSLRQTSEGHRQPGFCQPSAVAMALSRRAFLSIRKLPPPLSLLRCAYREITKCLPQRIARRRLRAHILTDSRRKCRRGRTFDGHELCVSVAVERLRQMMTSVLEEVADLPERVTDPDWVADEDAEDDRNGDGATA
jgi:hypothetical protein